MQQLTRESGSPQPSTTCAVKSNVINKLSLFVPLPLPPPGSTPGKISISPNQSSPYNCAVTAQLYGQVKVCKCQKLPWWFPRYCTRICTSLHHSYIPMIIIAYVFSDLIYCLSWNNIMTIQKEVISKPKQPSCKKRVRPPKRPR